MPTARSSRNQLVDALRFFAITLVPAQHLLSLRSEFMYLPGSSRIVAFILSFDMPLFTFLAGYVLFGREGAGPLRFIRGKALALLVPYFAWVAVVMPLRHIPPSGWLPRLGSALVNPRAGFQMWYLWILFALFVVFALARLVSTADLWTGGVALAAGTLLFLPLPQTFGADKIAWLYPFLVLGYLCGKHRETLRCYDAAIAITGTVAFLALSAWGSTAAPARLAAGAGGIITAWAVYRLLPPVLLGVQAWAGQKTLGIYGAQMLVLPYVMVGEGWAGAIASEITVMASATTIAWALSLSQVTRAVFLGQWPRKARG